MTDELVGNDIERARVLPEPLKRWTGSLLKRVAQKVRDSFESRINESGLRSNCYGALIMLEDGPKTQIELARLLWVDRTTMVAIVDDLEASGNVRRERHPEDRRAYALHLTDLGRATLAKGKQIADEVESEIFSALSDDEREQLRGLLARLI